LKVGKQPSFKSSLSCFITHQEEKVNMAKQTEGKVKFLDLNNKCKALVQTTVPPPKKS
jgi:hypothetical protein